MAITIQDLPDSQIPEACAFEHAAFASDPLGASIFPGPFDENSAQHKVDSLIQARKEDPAIRYLAAYDGDSGRIVAFSKWYLYETDEAAKNSARPERDYGPGSNPEACEKFFGGLAAKKKAVMGERPHYYLHVLYADPEFQGKGAGGQLLKWGMQRADELGLPVYLESSDAGFPVYRHYGFEEVDKLVVDFSPYGGSKEHITPIMIRQPIKKP